MLVPLLSNDRNHDQWPRVVSEDVMHHINNLKSSVFVISGQVNGKTLLPLPAGADHVEEELLDRFQDDDQERLEKIRRIHVFRYTRILSYTITYLLLHIYLQ